MASYSRNVIYGPKGVHDARTNSERIPLGRIAGRIGAATNQAAEEGFRVVRNGRMSACNSAPGVGTSPQDGKKASRNLLSRLALQCRGDWIRTSDLLNPIQEPTQPNSLPHKADTASHSSACTTACTSEPGTANAGTVEALAAALLGLSPADRARLAALLIANPTPAGDGK
jgi:hypothetical protein